MRKYFAGIAFFCGLTALSGHSFANDAEILRRLEKLADRVAELEKEVAVSRREATRARAELAKVRPSRTPAITTPLPAVAPNPEFSSAVSPLVAPRGWTGPYFGLGLGAAVGASRYSAIGSNVSSSLTTTRTPNFSSTSNSATLLEGVGLGESLKRVGGIASLAAGYDIQFHPHFLAGLQLEGSVPFLSMDQDVFGTTRSNTVGVTNSTTFLPPLPPQISTQNTSQSVFGASAYRIKFAPAWMASGLFRFGVLLTPDTLAYAAAGAGYAKFDTDAVSKNLGIPTFVLGGGVEQRLTGNWTISADYRFHHLIQTTVREGLASASFTSAAGQASSLSSSGMNISRFDGSIHAFRVGLNYRFQ